MTFEFVELPERKSPQAETGAFFAGEWKGPAPVRRTTISRPMAPLPSVPAPPEPPLLLELTPTLSFGGETAAPMRVVRPKFIPADVGVVRRSPTQVRPPAPGNPRRNW